MSRAKPIAEVGRPYGHVPGHQYLDVEIFQRRADYLLRITWGSAQGRDEEHGREEYAETTLEALRATALEGQTIEERRKLIQRAYAEAADRPPGRPRESDDGDGRTDRLRIRVTPGEKARIKALAKEAGFDDVSDYVRGKVL